MTEILENNWSDWRDFDQETFANIPEVPGVYMMHAAMEILFIGGSENLKKSIQNTSEKYLKRETRLRYREEINFQNIKEKLVKDYQKRHEGNLPEFMN